MVQRSTKMKLMRKQFVFLNPTEPRDREKKERNGVLMTSVFGIETHAGVNDCEKKIRS